METLETDVPFGERSFTTDKLPFWSTLKLTFADYFRGFADVLRITCFWIVLLLLVSSAANAFKWSWAAWIFERFRTGELQDSGISPVIAGTLYFVTAILLPVAGVDVAVAWHRRVLLPESPLRSVSSFSANAAWQYLALSLLLCLVAALPALLIFVMAATGLEIFISEDAVAPAVFDGLVAVAGISVLLTGGAVFSRLALVLPARAVGNTTFTWRQSWKASRGSTFQLLAGAVLCAYLVPNVIQKVVQLVIGIGRVELPLNGLFTKDVFPDGMMKDAATLQVAIARFLLTLPLYIGFLSHSYRHLVRRLPGDAIGEA